MEIWKDVDFRYEVSTFGNVRSKDRTIFCNNGKVQHRKGKVLKPQTISNGYLAVYLMDENGKQVWKYVHRLVAEAFIPNPDNLPQVNHKDEDRLNNHIDNLEWCTAKYNMNYGTHQDRSLDTRIKKGYCRDLRGLTISQRKDLLKEDNRKRHLERYTKKRDNRVVVYEIKTEYVKVGEFDNYTQAANYIGSSTPTIKDRIKNGNKKPIFKKYIVEKAV